MTKKNNLIYHYCSLDTFLKIIKYKTIRLSNITKTNDYLERSYILFNSKDVIYNILVETYPNYIEDKLHANKYIVMIESYLKKYIDFYNEQSIICHALCFSKDADKLSQWARYADDGRGIAIGFDRQILEKYFNKEQYISLNDVIYSENNNNVLEEELYEIVGKMKISRNYLNDTVEAIINTICEKLVIRMFLNKAFIYKNPAFQEENEVRIHTNIPLEEFGYLTYTKEKLFFEKLKLEISPLITNYDFFAKVDKIVSYIDICFDTYINDRHIPNEFIKEIVIGPKVNISDSEIRHILDINCLGGVEFKKSKASYR